MRGVVRAAALVAVLMLGAAVTADAQVDTRPICKTLEMIRGDYPDEPTPAQVGEMLYRAAVVYRPDWALLEKTSGNLCPTPGGRKASCDHLVYLPTRQSFDVLIDASGTSGAGETTACDPKRGAGKPHTWVIQSDGRTVVSQDGKVKRALLRIGIELPAGTVTEKPKPEPAPPGTGDDTYLELLAALETRLSRMEPQTAQCAHESLQAAIRAIAIEQKLDAHDRNLTEHREASQRVEQEARSLFKRAKLDWILPIGGAAAMAVEIVRQMRNQ